METRSFLATKRGRFVLTYMTQQVRLIERKLQFNGQFSPISQQEFPLWTEIMTAVMKRQHNKM